MKWQAKSNLIGGKTLDILYIRDMSSTRAAKKLEPVGSLMQKLKAQALEKNCRSFFPVPDDWIFELQLGFQ